MADALAVANGAEQLAMQANERAIRVEERVVAVEKTHTKLDQEQRELRREMTEMYVQLREKIDDVGRGVYALLWVAAGTTIVMLIGAVAYFVVEGMKVHQ